ncbi:NAD(P)/FAD-dependent oxidoreductase [Pseudolabrys taiwanensis]|uniref:NADH:ubiquinone reductase (non-electrogenic) n=1 Tax=Pseudolabrys taiwanensis TaxID=331696 RepID=A0A346A057_9HYPH|nr:NAD(P)/FAD-dependent oxidoreductase [Pseudolabrys taiwanensis]AXK82554.1 NAD(P)/FAD-dependent oxidoreductase [Pseudolabrys taiwanensis]
MALSVPRIVVVGAGFGGLEAAKALDRAAAEVTVIDRHNHHCFQPLLYQVATAALSPADVAWPIRHILRDQRNATVLMEEVVAVDAARKYIRTTMNEIPYDYLVLATGATHSYFGHDEWAPVAPGLKRIEDATRIRRSILIAFERAEAMADRAAQNRLLTFVIVGGGATGVEMAGAIADIARQTLAADFRNIDPRAARIVLIEAGPRLLPAFPPDMSDYVRATLMKAGVDVRTDTMVTKCDEGGVDTNAGRIDAGTVIWAAGVVASPAARWLGVEADRAGRVKVGPDLSLPDHPEIFVIGDTAAVFASDGHPVPGIAPAAKQMGHYVGTLIAARVAGQSGGKPFRYRHLGDLATIGRRAAVVKFGRLQLKGFVGWVFWSVAHIYFLIGLRYRFMVAFTWFWDYLTFQRGARLITGSEQPRQK